MVPAKQAEGFADQTKYWPLELYCKDPDFTLTTQNADYRSTATIVNLLLLAIYECTA